MSHAQSPTKYATGIRLGYYLASLSEKERFDAPLRYEGYLPFVSSNTIIIGSPEVKGRFMLYELLLGELASGGRVVLVHMNHELPPPNFFPSPICWDGIGAKFINVAEECYQDPDPVFTVIDLSGLPKINLSGFNQYAWERVERIIQALPNDGRPTVIAFEDFDEAMMASMTGECDALGIIDFIESLRCDHGARIITKVMSAEHILNSSLGRFIYESSPTRLITTRGYDNVLYAPEVIGLTTPEEQKLYEELCRDYEVETKFLACAPGVSPTILEMNLEKGEDYAFVQGKAPFPQNLITPEFLPKNF